MTAFNPGHTHQNADWMRGQRRTTLPPHPVNVFCHTGCTRRLLQPFSPVLAGRCDRLTDRRLEKSSPGHKPQSDICFHCWLALTRPAAPSDELLTANLSHPFPNHLSPRLAHARSSFATPGHRLCRRWREIAQFQPRQSFFKLCALILCRMDMMNSFLAMYTLAGTYWWNIFWLFFISTIILFKKITQLVF